MFELSLLIASLVSGGAGGQGSYEVIQSEAGEILTVTRVWIPFAGAPLVILIPSEGGDEILRFWGQPAPSTPFYRRAGEPDPMRIAGPAGWGLVGGAAYSVWHRRSPQARIDWSGFGTNIGAGIQASADLIGLDRNRGDRERAQEYARRMYQFQDDHGMYCRPLVDYIDNNAVRLANAWDLYFDTVYTTLEDVITAAVREGRMYVWDLHETGDVDIPWTARAPFPTEIDGPFRILRAGRQLQNLYFVAETGLIYTDFGENHRRIGAIRDFAGDDRNLTLIFEDQQQREIGFLRADAAGDLAVLEIAWDDDSFAADFLTAIESDDLREDILQLAEIIRRDAAE